YKKAYTKVVTLLATPDETYSKNGIVTGGSVGLESATFEFWQAGLVGHIKETDGVLTINNPGHQNAITGVSHNPTTGDITITHDEMNAVVGVSIQTMNPIRIPIVISSTATQTVVRFVNNSGTEITSLTGINFQISRTGMRRMPNDKSDIAGSNFWVQGLMLTEYTL